MYNLQKDIYLDVDKAELNARLCRVGIVSWRWNWRGMLAHLSDGNFAILKNHVEVGVIAQNVRQELQDIFPGITEYSRLRVLSVDYNMLAAIIQAHLPYLADRYKEAPHRDDADPKLEDLQDCLTRYEKMDIQRKVVSLLALTHTYNKELQIK